MQITAAPTAPLASAANARRIRLNWAVFLRIGAALLIFGLALFLRLRAVQYLDADFDEDNYLRAGQLYAQHIAAGDIAGVANERYNLEHTPMTKLFFGAILYATHDDYEHPITAYDGSEPADPSVATQAEGLRTFDAIVGALTAGIVAFFSPVAGLLVAVNSWHIKYTSEAMLEALPCLFATVLLLTLRRSKRNGDRAWWLGAVLLGITAAGDYLYAVIGVAVLIWAWQRSQRSWRMFSLWLAIALVTFYIFDPALWFNPIGHLWDSIAFNANYSTSQQVADSGYGWTQPLVWLFASIPWFPKYHPETFPVLLDGLFAFFGLLALPKLWRTDRLLVWWIVVDMFFLFFWPTKWPQYILTMTVPISLAAASWLQTQRRNIWSSWKSWWQSGKAGRREARTALGWLLPSLILFCLIVVYPLVVQTEMATTTFKLLDLRQGVAGLNQNFVRGFFGLPEDSMTAEPYYGMAAIFYVLSSPMFFNVLRFNILWVGVTMALATVLGIWLATLLQRRGLKGRSFWYLLFILPWAIPEFVGAMIWSTFFDDANGAISFITGPNLDWLGDPKPLINFTALVKPVSTALNSWHLNPIGGILQFVAETLSINKPFLVVVLVTVWIVFPFMMVIATVALRAIPLEIYEAATLDNARGWTLWRGITWPLIKPAIWTGGLLRGALLFNAFQIPLLLASGGGRSSSIGTLATLGYLSLRNGNNFSQSALIDTVALICAGGLVWLFSKRTQVVEGAQYAR